jgi:ABC-type nitrate/sulfonate/bicarbonate transport system substrate-binding protein
MKQILIATLFALGVSCAPAATPTPTPVKVRVGYLLADLHHIAHIVAQDKEAGGGTSFYEKYGLVVEDGVGAPYANGGVEMDHFAANDLDIGMLGAPPAITKHLNAGVDTVIVGQVNAIGSALVVAKDIGKFSDLTGKTVATPGHSSIQFFLLLNYAEQQGVDIGKINVIDMAPKDMRAAMEKGDLAAFIAWEPFPAEATVVGFGKILTTSQDIWPYHLDCVVAVNRKFAQANPDTVVRFMRAQQDATTWTLAALAQPESKRYARLVELAMKFTGRDAAVVKEAFSRIQFKTALDANFTQSLTQYTNKLIQFKIVAGDKLAERGYKSADDFVTRYVDPSFLTRAQGK